MVNAIVLMGGGLDSLLVSRLMKKTPLAVRHIHFDIGLTYDKPIVAGQRISKYFGLEDVVRNGIEIDKVDIAKEFYSYLLNIKDFSDYNACLEYKIFLLKKAKEYIKEIDAQFIVTGDVVGQRIAVQGIDALMRADKLANVKGEVFRPLSAKLMDNSSLFKTFPPLAEISYDFEGFSDGRHELAKELGLVYTDNREDKFITQELDMGRKAFEIFEKQMSNNPIHLNRVGIHFQLTRGVRCVIGRTPFESNYLKNFYKNLLDKGLSFGDYSSKMLFGFIYSGNITEVEENLALSIFASVEKLTRVQIFDKEGEFLGNKDVISMSKEDVERYILRANDIYCPLFTFRK